MEAKVIRDFFISLFIKILLWAESGDGDIHGGNSPAFRVGASAIAMAIGKEERGQ